MAMAESQEPEQPQPGHNHGEGYHPELNGVRTISTERYYSDSTSKFQSWLGDSSPSAWDINCAQCCCYFLDVDRGYGVIHGRAPCVEFGEAPHVTFGEELTTLCKVDVSPKWNGEVKTKELDGQSIQALHNWRSYRIYNGPPIALAQQHNWPVRLETIAIDQLNGQEELNNCRFSFADAALLEKDRKRKDKPSLRGKCICPSPPEIKKEKVQDGKEIKVEPLCTGVSGLSLK